ncbi:latrotoxin-related protein [Wolbachia endosymbiont (group B) of Pandemis cinnamomeana]|uniref:latrotoxin-related protein n=1 Tax=Wolbachia endosymbiont (group B) of Pandemis cinnamomeana TaxID=2954038 RepID=UPI00248D2258|nr:latrotoxin-related protein [Wolbachia endosymbiont (group B) of Pandemis cinnamomeana]
MLKVEHLINYLKKERIDPQANELLSKERLKRQSVLKRIKRANSSQDNIKSFTAPGDGSCFFWSVALAYLIPVKDDEQSFSIRYRNLFGDDSDQQFNLSYNQRFGNPPNVLAKEAEVRNFFQSYNPYYGYPENDSLKELVRRVFRNRVVDYVSSQQGRLLDHIVEKERYIENMRIDSIDVSSWADNPEIGAVMERFNIDLDITGHYLDSSIVGQGNNNNVERVSISLSYVNNNHYNYHLDQDIARGYYDKLLKDSSRVLKTSSKNDPVPFSGDSDEGNEVPLTKKDIINIADIEYDWGVGDSSAVIFDVVDTNELLRKCTSQLLDKVKQNNKPLVYIVDLGSSHWVTLVIVYRDEQFFAYYIDPLGKKVDDNLKEHLKKENIHCPNIEVKQTDFNTGTFALKNLEVIFKGKRSTQKVILEQRPSFSIGINAELEKMKPPKNGQVLKDEIDKNDKYKRVGYNDLNSQLDLLCSQLKREKNGETTFIILSGGTHGVILTVGFRDEQVVACYVANDSTYTNDIKSLLSQKGIIPIFTKDDISRLLTEFKNDIELFTLQSARVVTNYFKNHDYITLAKDELKKAVSGKEVEGVINRLKARNKIEDKIVRCKSVIDKYIKRYGTKLIGKDFTEAQSNILILFLESIALEDMELSRSLGEKLKRIRTRIMSDEDYRIIDIIRSKNLVHRSDSNINTIIECGDINKFIRDGVSRVEFFGKLQTYLNQIIDKLNRKTIDSTHEIKVDSFFKTEGEIEKISYKVKTEEEIKEYLSNSFRKLVNTNSYSSKDTQMIMFKLVVNVIPLLEGLYSDKKKNKDKKLEIEELRNIQKEKNELMHNFHKYESEIARKFELKKFIDKIKPTFFKYIYSQRIYELLKGSTLQFSKNTIELKLKNSLRELLKDFNYVADEFGYQNKAVTFQSIASILEPSTSSEDFLRNFISNYVKLMRFIDNEDEIQKRKKKGPSLPQRYDQLTDNYDRLSDMRLYVYEYFNLLKQLYSKGSSYESEYKLIEVQLAKELKKKCGILKPSFESIVDLYVKGGNNINGDQFIKRIYDDIGTVSKIKGKGKDLKISDIIESYGKRESLQAKKGSTEEKFKIPKGEIVNINGVDVSTDRFVVNILKLFDSIASQYKNVFNNVEEAFNDETFLSFLTHNNINFSSQVWDKLLRINYLSPYIVELIVRDQLNDQSGLISRGLVNFDAFNGIIGKLLESNLRVVHLKKLLEISDDKLLTILGQNDVSLNRENIKSELYKQVCKRIRIDNVSNLYQLLEDEVHANKILNKLSEVIIPGNANNLDQQIIDLIKSTLDLLDRVSEELIYKKDYERLHKILNSAGVENLVSTLLQIDNSDLYALKIRRRRAVIENEKDEEYDTAKRTLEDIKDRIQLNAQEEIQSFFLLISSDIAYTKHLKQEYKEAYKEYEALYKKMIELSLNSSIDDWSKFYLVGTYNKVMKSQKYVSILEYSPKYLDILKIRSDMAYELRSFALSKEKESQDEALKSYEDALKIYEEVYEIKATDSVLGQDIVKNIRDIAYVNNKLAKLKLSSSKLGEALSHYDKVLEMYSQVLRIQEKEQWETHPANSKTIQDIVQAMHNVAYVNNKLGSSNNPEEALEHHTKALEIYEEVYKFQKSSPGEEHEYTLKTIENVAFTHNKLARLKKSSNNPEGALQHYEEAEGNYRKVYNIKLRLFGEEDGRTKSTKNELDKTGKWKKDLLEKHPQLTLLSLPFSSEECLSDQGNRKKREAKVGECLFTWEDVDKFNEEKDEKRDFSKIEIDSEKLVNYIKDLPEEKRSQLIQLADKVRVAGNSQSFVSKLISNQKVISHLNRVGRVSGMTMHGMMAKNVLADFLNGDYQGVAINIGFIAGGQGFAKVAEAASLKGLKLASEGKLLLGRSLRAASPFLARGTSAFVVYDLVNQVKAFKNGTEEALVGVVGDSIYLGVDAAEVGIEIAEAFEVLEGVSSVTGPIGATIGAVVFVGTDVYMAVKRVDKIDQIIHLTGKEKFIEGLRAFIGMKPEQYIEELMGEKQSNNMLVQNAIEFLKNNTDVHRYVFPSSETYKKLVKKVVPAGCPAGTDKYGGCKGAIRWREIQEERIAVRIASGNSAFFDKKVSNVIYNRSKPDNPNEGELFCLPADLIRPQRGGEDAYLCHNVIGLHYGTNRTGNNTLINLGEGEDYAKGFLNSPNIFVVNNGFKIYDGGGKDDVFILQGNDIKGYLYGEGGVNTLDLTEFALNATSVDVVLDRGDIIYGSHNVLQVFSMDRILGRQAERDHIFSSCDTQFIDGQSGAENNSDIILIDNNNCTYKIQIVVRPNTVVYNRALKGSFDYLVPLNSSGSAELSFIYGPERFNLNNTFWFAYQAVDIKSIDVKYINVFNRTEHEVKFNFIKSEKEFNVTIHYAENPSYRLGKSGEIKIGNKDNLYMLQSSNESSEEIIKNYLPLASRLNKMSFFIQSLLSNETVVIGSGNHEVIHNNPAYRSHLVGNGGENVYVIDSESKKFEVAIPEVIIYDLDIESSVDTIDLRNLVSQVRGKLSNQDHFQLKVLKSANDLLLKAIVEKPIGDSSISEKHEYFAVRLKDGVNWYNKTHVIMDNVPMRISLDNNEWSLKPQPLMFEKDKEVIVVTSQDVEENTELITPKKAGNYTFVRDHGSDLMITNAFNTQDDLCTIVLSKFYETPKMETLSIKFADKEIVLKDKQEEISTARYVDVVKREHKEQVYNDVFNRSPEVMLSDQPHRHRHRHQIRHRRSTSGSARPSSWINDLFGWVKSSIGGLLSSTLSKETSSTPSSISQVHASVDVNSTIMLLDVFVRKVTGQKYISTVDQSISPLEAQGYALNITNRFEKVVKQAAKDSKISMHRLNVDSVAIQKEITEKIMSGKFNEISGVLSSYVEKACPGREAGCPGKLSKKRFNEFMAKFNKGLDVTLNQSIEHNGDDTLEVNNIEEQQGPRSYLNNTSIQGHLTRNKVKLIS